MSPIVMLDHSATSSKISLRPTLPASADKVLSALRGAADETGADFGYLLKTARRESSLNPEAKASSSSATGLFQFIEQTWLGTMRNHGAEHGLNTFADAIKVGKDGRFTVADKGLRQEILALRKDPKVASLMAGEMTNDMRGDMEAALGRGVSAGELYVAHFLGPQAAVKMIKAATATPAATAATLFPDAASANPTIFYQKNGAARSVNTVLESLKAKHQGQGTPSTVDYAQAQASPVANESSVQGLRGSINDTRSVMPTSAENIATNFGMNAVMMSPLMAQLLSAIDPLPSLAHAFRPDDEQPRRDHSL
jgi:hypothetical protein